MRVYAWDMRVLCSEILIKFAKCSIAIDAALGALRGKLHSPRLWPQPRWMANNAYQPQTAQWAAAEWGHKPMEWRNGYHAVFLDRLWLLRSERVRSTSSEVKEKTPSSHQMPNMKFFEINFCFSYRAAAAACPHWERTQSIVPSPSRRPDTALNVMMHLRFFRLVIIAWHLMLPRWRRFWLIYSLTLSPRVSLSLSARPP